MTWKRARQVSKNCTGFKKYKFALVSMFILKVMDNNNKKNIILFYTLIFGLS